MKKILSLVALFFVFSVIAFNYNGNKVLGTSFDCELPLVEVADDSLFVEITINDTIYVNGFLIEVNININDVDYEDIYYVLEVGNDNITIYLDNSFERE
jgi:hypothetical protein